MSVNQLRNLLKLDTVLFLLFLQILQIIVSTILPNSELLAHNLPLIPSLFLFYARYFSQPHIVKPDFHPYFCLQSHSSHLLLQPLSHQCQFQPQRLVKVLLQSTQKIFLQHCQVQQKFHILQL